MLRGLFTFWKRANLNQTERMLDVLKDKCWHTNMELGRKVSLRYGDVVFRLRKNGHTVNVERITKGLFKYKLIK